MRETIDSVQGTGLILAANQNVSGLSCHRHLIPPLHVTERGAVEFVPVMTPLGHEIVHQGDEAGVMCRFQQMLESVEFQKISAN
jgi:hypothetical protein